MALSGLKVLYGFIAFGLVNLVALSAYGTLLFTP